VAPVNLGKKVIRIIGGAGSGKTSRLMAEIDEAAARHGGIDAVGFSSMTRAARSEAVGRAARAFGVTETDLSRDGWFRTLHGVCYASLGMAAASMVTDDLKSETWLREEVFADHSFGGGSNVAFGYRRKVTPDVAIDVWNYARNSVIPLRLACAFHRVPLAKVSPLVERYESAKRIHGRHDFPDLMLEFVGCRYPTVTSDPVRVEPRGDCPPLAVWLFDESQDMNRLCDLVARRLASEESVERVVICGDPFQSIFGFSGSSAKWMMRWPAEQEIMPVSHRCPADILAAGEGRLRRLKGGEYWDRGIQAARPGGSLESTPSVRNLLSRVEPTEDWLLIARSNYQAKKMADEADRAGIPWQWTKECESETDITARAGFRAAVALERGSHVTPGEIESLFTVIPSQAGGERLWKHGSKSQFAITQWPAGKRFAVSDLEEIGATPALSAALASPQWTSIAKAGAEKYRRLAAKHGDKLTAMPRVRIGTIHSVKGAEADNVGILYAPTDRSVKQQRKSREVFNEERRIEYVAVTRAKRRLVACYPPRTGFGPGRLW